MKFDSSPWRRKKEMGIKTGKRLKAILCAVGFLAIRSQADLGAKNEVRLYGGIFAFDLMGVGKESFTGLAYSKPVNSALAIKGSASFVRTLQQYGVRIPYLIPEIGVEIGKQFGPAKPFLGGGAGVIVDLRTSISDSASYVVNSGSGTQTTKDVETVGLYKNTFDTSFFGEIGVRFDLPNQVSALIASAKIRAHEVDLSGVSSEVGIGISTSF